MKNKRIAVLTIVVVAATAFVIAVFVTRNKKGVGQNRPPQVSDKDAKANAHISVRRTERGNKITIPSGIGTKQAFEEINREADFHVYYPAFIPPEIELNRESAWWFQGSEELSSHFMYNIGVLAPDSQATDVAGVDSRKPLVWVVQYKGDSKEAPYILTKSVEDRREITIDGQKGFYGATGEDPNRFVHVIYSTNDNVAVWIRSKSFDSSTLIKIAESML